MKKENIKITAIVALSGLLGFLVLADIISMIMVSNQSRTIKLLKDQQAILLKDQKIIMAASDLSSQYRDEIKIISEVFPNENTIAEFIKNIEELTQATTKEYRIQFNSLTPLPEGDKLYLLLTLNMKTDYAGLMEFFDKLETIPHMTHVYSVTIASPEGIDNTLDTRIYLKLYVQKPFNN